MEQGIKEEINKEVTNVLSNLLESEIMMNTIAHNVLLRALNALDFKMHHSKERVPKMIITKVFIPGANKVIYRVDNSDNHVISVYEGSSDKLIELPEPTKLGILGILYNYYIEPNTECYLITDVDMDIHREKMAEQMAVAMSGENNV